MSISLVVAMDEGGLIGRDGGLPWRLPEDLKHFRRVTLGKTVLMGRRTFASIGKALDGRRNWVLSRDPQFQASGCEVFPSLAAALAAHTDGELMVIGGEALFRETLPRARRLYLTRVHARLAGDTWFPAWDERQFREIERTSRPADDRHPHALTFVTLERT